MSGRYGSIFIFLHIAGTLHTCMKEAANKKSKSWGGKRSVELRSQLKIVYSGDPLLRGPFYKI